MQVIEFKQNEYPSSILQQADTLYVGLTIISQNDKEHTCPEAGRVLNYTFNGELLVLKTQADFTGAIMDMTMTGSHFRRLLIAVNNKLIMLGAQSLTLIKQVDTQIIIYKLKVYGDYILVADVMRSFSVYLVYSDSSKYIELSGRYPHGQWCFDMAMIDDSSYITCDFDKNLCCLEDLSEPDSPILTDLLKLSSSTNINQQVNCIVPNQSSDFEGDIDDVKRVKRE